MGGSSLLKEISSKSLPGKRFRRRIEAPACSPQAKNVGRVRSQCKRIIVESQEAQSSGTYLSRPAQVWCLNTEHIEQAASWRSMGARGQLSRKLTCTAELSAKVRPRLCPTPLVN